MASFATAATSLPESSSAATLSDTLEALESLRFEQRRRQVTVLVLVLVAPTAAFAVIDFITARGNQPHLVALVALRIFSVLIAGAFVYWISRTRDERRFDAGVNILSYVIAAFVVAIHLLRPRTLVTMYNSEIVIVVALYAMLPMRWLRQAIPATVISVVGLVLLFTWHQEVATVQRAAITIGLLLANGVGISIGWHQDWLQHREELLVESARASRLALLQTTAELRILQKILPICAHCRQVRTGAGDWAGLEAYVGSHSDTRFSHGICPDCMARHYPDEAPVGSA